MLDRYRRQALPRWLLTIIMGLWLFCPLYIELAPLNGVPQAQAEECEILWCGGGGFGPTPTPTPH